MKYQERDYRSLINKDNLASYNVTIAESDLFIRSDSDLHDLAFKSLTKHRNYLESYINNHPEFKTSLLPLPEDKMAPPIVRNMIRKSNICGVGPMASVAGAISEFVGYDLLHFTNNLIIENGGDIFMLSKENLNVSIFAGESTLSHRVKVLIKSNEMPIGICTSSATVGPSLSFGNADAVSVIAKSATLADAAASAVCNRVKSDKDIKSALDYGINIAAVKGIIIIIGNNLGAIGDIEFI